MRLDLICLNRVQRRSVRRAICFFIFVLSVAVVAILIHLWTWPWQISSFESTGSRQLGTAQVNTVKDLLQGMTASRLSEPFRTAENITDAHENRQQISSQHKSTLTTRTQCEQNYFLLILVSSAPANFDQRRKIRQTWATDNSLKLRWKTVFLLGQTRNSNNSKKLQHEGAIYGDLIRADYYEDYLNLTLKDEMGLEWAARYCNFSFVLKVDDDVFINTPAVLNFLNDKTTPQKRLYLGFVNRNANVQRTGKYRVTIEEYKGSNYPDYCAGSGYILSRDVIISFVDIFNTIPKFKMEDVYMGILAKKAGVIPTHHDGFQTTPFSTGCVLLDNTLVRHGIVGQCLLDLFEKVKPALN